MPPSSDYIAVKFVPIFNAFDKSAPISENVCEVLLFTDGVSGKKGFVTP